MTTGPFGNRRRFPYYSGVILACLIVLLVVSLGTAVPDSSHASPALKLTQGDVDCNQFVNPIDALKILRFDAGLDVQQAPDCPQIGSEVASLFGDVDCSGGVGPIDALKVLRYDGGLAFTQNDPCPNVGTPLGDAKPESEHVLMLYDDMQNGRFDTFVSAPDAEGSFSIADDGGGNLVARLSGDMSLIPHPYATEFSLWADFETVVRIKRGASGEVSFGLRWSRISKEGYWLSNSGNEWTISRQDGNEVNDLVTATHTTPIDTWFQLQILVRTVEQGVLIEANLESEPFIAFIDPDEIETGGIEFALEGLGAELSLDDVRVDGDVDSRYTWTQTGGPFGGWVVDVAVDPSDWRIAYAGGVDGGVFKTTDGGTSWTEVGLPNGLWKVRVRNIELAPSDPSVVYVAVGPKGVSPLWRSDDSGDTWRWTAAADMQAGSESPPAPGEHLDEPGDIDVLAMGIDPTDPMHIFVGVHDEGVWESSDGGATLIDLESGGDVIRTITLNPGDLSHILAAPADPAKSGASLLASTDGGDNWAPSDAGLDGNFVQQLLFYPPDPTQVFAIVGHPDPGLGRMLYRSSDSGSSWSQLNSAPGIGILRFVSSGTDMLLGFAEGTVFGSTDLGDNWTSMEGAIDLGFPTGADVGVDDPDVIYVASPRGAAVSTDLGSTWQISVNGLLMHPISALTVDPSDPATVYTGGKDGLHRSTDYGETWTRLTTLAQGARDVNAVAVDPSDPDTIYRAEGIEFVMGEVFKSTDGGSTWDDITGDISYSIGTLVLDPNDATTIYAGTGGGPQAGPQGLGLYRSTDGGDNWAKLAGVPDVAVPTIIVDRLDSNHIVIGTMGHGVMASFDGGETFEERNTGIGDTDVDRMIYSLAMNPDNPNIMYAGTHSWYGQLSGANTLYKTTDGGLNWTPLIQGEKEHEYPFVLIAAGIDTIDIVPGHSDWIYVGLHDPGVIFTDNGGADWRWANHGLTPLLTHIYPYRMAMSPDGDVLYSGGCGRSVFRNHIFATEE